MLHAASCSPQHVALSALERGADCVKGAQLQRKDLHHALLLRPSYACAKARSPVVGYASCLRIAHEALDASQDLRPLCPVPEVTTSMRAEVEQARSALKSSFS